MNYLRMLGEYKIIMRKDKELMYPKEFIEKVLIQQIQTLIPSEENNGLPYHSFILISIGIEFLGACEDRCPWHGKHIDNRKRFNTGLKLLPNKKYLKHKDVLYGKLRCGLAHSFAPVAGIGLGEKKNQTPHLLTDPTNGDLCLRVETLFDDFVIACKKVIERIDAKDYDSENKIYKKFLAIPTEQQ